MEDKSEDTISTPQELEPIDTPTSQTEVSPELPVVVTGGRRRGRRKVMKKKTVKDDEGYLGSYRIGNVGCAILTLKYFTSSDKRRACMGVVLRR